MYINQEGTEATDIARFYHKVYAMIAGYKYLNQTDGTIPHGEVPQTFAIEPSGTYTPLKSMQYNHRILPPGEVYECYAEKWGSLMTELSAPPEYFDPRLDLCDVS